MKHEKSVYQLSDVIDLIGGGTPKTSVSEYWGGNIPWLSVKDFNNDDRYVYTTEKSITQTGLDNSSTKLLDHDDIIISARGTVGELAMIPFPMAFNQSCYGIRGKKDIIIQPYLYYLLKDSISLLKSQTHGSVFDTITRETFDNIKVCLPSIEEQQIIADTLTALDDKVALSGRINHHLTLLRTGMDRSPDIRRGNRVSRRVIRVWFSSVFWRIWSNIGVIVALNRVSISAFGIHTSTAFRFA
jgi:type I restriction enzyme, S subunit